MRCPIGFIHFSAFGPLRFLRARLRTLSVEGAMNTTAFLQGFIRVLRIGVVNACSLNREKGQGVEFNTVKTQ